MIGPTPRPRRALAIAAVALVLAIAGAAAADGVPAEAPPDLALGTAPSAVTITAPVTDLAGRLAGAERDALAARLRRLRDATGVQMAVVVVDSTAPLAIEAFAQAVFDRWGGGRAGRDDGVLFVLAIGDRTNRLHLGDGIARVIADREARRILDAARPALRDGRYADAAAGVIDAVAGHVAHVRPGGPLTRRPPPPGAGSPVHLIAIVALAIAAAAWWSRRRARRARTGPSWYLARPAALLGIAAGSAAVTLVYRDGPGAAFGLVWAGAALFGLAITAALRRGWRGTVLALVILGVPIGIPVGAIGLALADQLGFASVEAVQATAFVATIALLALAAVLYGGMRLADGAGAGGSSHGTTTATDTSWSSSTTTSSTSTSGSSGGGWSGGGGRSSGGGASSSW